MKLSRMILSAFLISTVALSGSQAAVFVGDLPATDQQLSAKSSDGEKATIADTLSNSIQESITNGYNSVGNTDLVITKSWHKGGSLPYDDTFEHVTVEVYKNDVYVKTCHAYSFQTKLDGPYQASCVKSK
ncbi:hypothetical protein [Pseudovibrio sp. Ad37]|uniref:hypothetical protein n=1 Tax=Pseudovibrio sp. Ad37 TaxID=989422 RepID=UPI0007B2CB82|nr:hypothetical protein [Pseudovibrio sp. Ad37]KZL24043.1 hypothetical protein PsAD37_02890 [Pseudovibrio sp. Ad37]